MESFIGLILLVAAVATIIFYKGAIKKTGQYTEDVVTVNIAEAQTDLVKRSEAAYNRLIEECGEDFMTAQEVYDKMMKIKKKPIQTKKKKQFYLRVCIFYMQALQVELINRLIGDRYVLQQSKRCVAQ